MTLGSRTRRAAPGLVVLTIVAMGGCHAMPLGRLATSPNSPQSTLASASRAALLPATVAMEPPPELSSIEPVTSLASSLTPSGPAEPAPTPLLDAALERAKGLEAIALDEMSRPLTPPMPTPTPAPVPVPSEPPKSESVAATVPPASPAPASAEAAREPRKAEEPDPPRPEEIWRDGVRRLGSLARAKLDQSDGVASPWGLRARILAWLAEPDIDPDLDQHDSDGVRAVLKALDEPPAGSPRRGDEVRSAVLVLEDRAPLEIVDLRLCSKVERFGDFEPFEPPVRKAGQPVILYCEVDGIRFEQTSAGFRTRLAAQLEILPEGGGAPVLTRSLGTAEETCRRRRRDYYIAYKLVLPKPLPPGDYRIRITEKDLTADRSASREVAFAISKD